MKFSVGYRLTGPEETSFVEIVREFHAHISEVYFPWVGMASGRAPLRVEDHEQLHDELEQLRALGVRLNLVLNASCHGADAFTRDHADRIRQLLAELSCDDLVNSVTTMSPLIARVVKADFPHIKTRASVNMRLGTVQAFEYVADIFDGYNMQRDHQRDIARMTQLKAWCDAHGKTLHMLANSGCMAWCAVQTFHDNLVAHEAQIDHAACVTGHIPGSCWDYLRSPAHHAQLLANTWIRPEDARRYEPFVSELKLATRMHSHPRTVIRAYCLGKFSGNLLDLFEPSHSGLVAPMIIDNRKFPADWFDRITAAVGDEELARYYAEVLKQVGVNLGARASSGKGLVVATDDE